jgi:hypothetical protein
MIEESDKGRPLSALDDELDAILGPRPGAGASRP